MDKEGIYKLIQKCFICQLKREGFWKKRFKSQHIKEINKKYQMTIIMVHHDINQAINYSDEIIAMKDGKILFQGVPEEVITSASLKSLYDYDLSVIDYNHQKIVLNYQ